MELILELEKRRKAEGKTVDEFARELGIQRVQYHRIRNGDSAMGMKAYRGIYRKYPDLVERDLARVG